MSNLSDPPGPKQERGYIASHIKSYAISLRVLTLRGNYLSNLNVRTEQVDFASNMWERNMDDLILHAAISDLAG